MLCVCGLHTTPKLRHQHKDNTLRVCVCVCILGKVPALELDNVNRSRWGNLNALPLGYSRAGTKWEEVLEHLPARVDASTLASTETGWQRERGRERERSRESHCVVCVCHCVFSAVPCPLFFVLFVYLFFHKSVGPTLSFCFCLSTAAQHLASLTLKNSPLFIWNIRNTKKSAMCVWRSNRSKKPKGNNNVSYHSERAYIIGFTAFYFQWCQSLVPHNT